MIDEACPARFIVPFRPFLGIENCRWHEIPNPRELNPNSKQYFSIPICRDPMHHLRNAETSRAFSIIVADDPRFCPTAVRMVRAESSPISSIDKDLSLFFLCFWIHQRSPTWACTATCR